MPRNCTQTQFSEEEEEESDSDEGGNQQGPGVRQQGGHQPPGISAEALAHKRKLLLQVRLLLFLLSRYDEL